MKPPNFSAQQAKAYNESNARLNIWEGSVRSGKSYSCLWRFLKELRNGPEGQYVICGKSERTILHNIIEPLNMIMKGHICYNRGLGEFELWGRKVYIIGANDERAVGKIQGSTFAGALVDELTIIPETFFKMLLSRLSIANAKLFGTTNPDSPYHWLKTDYIDNENISDKRIFPFRLNDNPSLTKTFIENLEKEYKGLWHKRYIQGLWVLAEGAIYDFFDESIHVVREAPSYAKQFILGIDYGTTNPFSAILIGFNGDQRPEFWVEKEYYWDSKVTGYQKTDYEYARDVINHFDGYPISLIYLDPSAESFQVELKRQKKPVRQAKNDVMDGIRYVGSIMMSGDLVIKSTCTNLIKEIQGYVWDIKSARDGIDRPLKTRDHALDAMRYALYSHFGARASIGDSHQVKAPKQLNLMNYPGFGPNSIGWQGGNPGYSF